MSDDQSPLIGLDVQESGSCTVIQPHGRLSELETHELERELARLQKDGCHRLVLDMREVDFISSSGLGALMATLKQTRGQDGFLRLVKPQPLVMEILITTKLNRLFEVFDTVEAAVVES